MFLSAVLDTEILSTGISSQGMRTRCIQELLQTHLETAEGNPFVRHIGSNEIKSLVYIQGSEGWLNMP